MRDVSKVHIQWDDWGTPHIEASTEPLAAFGMGYAQARDQLQELLGQYLLVRSELASVVGPAAVPLDAEQHRWQVLERARSDYAGLSTADQDVYAAFVAGVQRYMDTHPADVPAWAPPLEPALPLGRVAVLTSRWLTMSAVAALTRAGVETAEVGPAGASNQWVLLPARTADGRTFLLGDPHLPLGGLFDVGPDGAPLLAQYQSYAYTLRAGARRYSGYTFVGTPVAGTGHNFHVAVTMTTGGPACSDVYRIVVDPGDPQRYLFDGAERRITSRDVEIRVLGEDAPRRFTMEHVTANGVTCPVVARDTEAAYVVCTPYAGISVEAHEQAREMRRATNVAEMKAALGRCTQLPQNILVADCDGNAFFVHGGRVPVRPPGLDWRLPLDGNTAAAEWLGIHPFEELVQVENPATGYLQNCNVAPDVMVADHSEPTLEPDAYVDYLYNDAPGRQNTRGRRAIELLSQTTAATVDDAIAIALDDRWPDTSDWQCALQHAADSHAYRESTTDPELLRYLEDLLAFDGHARPESVAALRWVTWREQLATTASGHGDRFKLLCDDVAAGRLPGGLESGWLLAAIERAREELHSRWGNADATYGEVFRIGRASVSHPGRGGALASRPPTTAEALGLEAPGLTSPVSVQPLRLAQYGPPDDAGRRWAHHGGYALRLTVLGDTVECYGVTLFGQSADPSSPHHADQAELFSRQRLVRLPLEPDEIERRCVAAVTLTR